MNKQKETPILGKILIDSATAREVGLKPSPDRSTFLTFTSSRERDLDIRKKGETSNTVHTLAVKNLLQLMQAMNFVNMF